jgi:hypothetical protein
MDASMIVIGSPVRVAAGGLAREGDFEKLRR